MRCLLAGIVVVGVACVICDTKNYFLPKTEAREKAYGNCLSHEKCVNSNTNFIKGVCYGFCFLDINGDGKVVYAEGYQVWTMLGKGKDVPHATCLKEFGKATHNLIPVDKICIAYEHESNTNHKKGVLTKNDITEFMNKATANHTIEYTLDRHLMLLELMRAASQNITFTA